MRTDPAHQSLVVEPITRSVAGDIAALLADSGNQYIHIPGDTYSEDCAACLRHQPHDDVEHERILWANEQASSPIYFED